MHQVVAWGIQVDVVNRDGFSCIKDARTIRRTYVNAMI